MSPLHWIVGVSLVSACLVLFFLNQQSRATVRRLILESSRNDPAKVVQVDFRTGQRTHSPLMYLALSDATLRPLEVHITLSSLVHTEIRGLCRTHGLLNERETVETALKGGVEFLGMLASRNSLRLYDQRTGDMLELPSPFQLYEDEERDDEEPASAS